VFPRNGFGTTKVDGKPKKKERDYNYAATLTRGSVKPNECYSLGFRTVEFRVTDFNASDS